MFGSEAGKRSRSGDCRENGSRGSSGGPEALRAGLDHTGSERPRIRGRSMVAGAGMMQDMMQLKNRHVVIGWMSKVAGNTAILRAILVPTAAEIAKSISCKCLVRTK